MKANQNIFTSINYIHFKETIGFTLNVYILIIQLACTFKTFMRAFCYLMVAKLVEMLAVHWADPKVALSALMLVDL